MKDFKIETESPLSIAEQIEVLELAKGKLLILSTSDYSAGLCYSISTVIHELHNRSIIEDVSVMIPSFNSENAVLSGTVDSYFRKKNWWDREISNGGLTNRLAFLDWLIERLKEAERENTKRTTTE